MTFDAIESDTDENQTGLPSPKRTATDDLADILGPEAMPAPKARTAAEDFKALEADLVQPAPAPKNSKGVVNDVLVGLGKGVMGLPEAATGLADIPAGLMGLDRPFDKATDIIGEKTGFQPSKWNKEAEKDYSPAMQEATRKINEAWQDPNTGALDVAKAYAQNPRGILKTVVESLPGMYAGNFVGGRLVGLGGKAARTLPAEELAKKAVLGGGIGEGSVMAGQAMSNIDENVDPQTAALASLVTGVGGGAIGATSGKIANELGLGDFDQIIASGGRTGLAEGAEQGATRTLAESAKALGKRVGAGALQEGVVEEGTQSALETAMQNLAEGKPITEDMARNVVEGTLAGGVMGAGANVYAPGKAPVIDPAAAAGQTQGQITPPEAQPVLPAPAEEAAAEAPPVPPAATQVAPPAPQDSAERTKSYVDDVLKRYEDKGSDISKMGLSRGLANAARENNIDIKGKKPVEIFNALREIAYPPAPQTQADIDQAEADRLEATGGLAAKATAANLRNGASTMAPPVEEVEVEQPAAEAPVPAEQPATGIITSGAEVSEAAAPVEQPEAVVEAQVDPYSPEALASASLRTLATWANTIRASKRFPKEQKKQWLDAINTERLRKNAAEQEAKAAEQEAKAAAQVEKPDSVSGKTPEVLEQNQDDPLADLPDLSGTDADTNLTPEAPAQTVFEVNGQKVDYNALSDEQKAQWDEAEANYQNTLKFIAQDQKIQRDSLLRAKEEKAAGMKHAAERRRITGLLTDKEKLKAEADAKKIRVDSPVELEDGRTGIAVSKPAFGNVKIKFENGSVENVPYKTVRIAQKPEALATTTDFDSETGKLSDQSPNTAAQKAEETTAPEVAPVVPIDEGSAAQNEILDQTPEADKQNGDYPKTRVQYQDLDIALENGAGSVRSGKDETGREWSQTMHDDYGEIPFVRDPETGQPIKTEGADKDHIDVFIKPGLAAEDTQKFDKVFIVDQVNPKTGAYDEHKVVLGYPSVAAARKAYNANYEPGWKGGAAVTGMPMAKFKEWLLNGDTKAPINPKAVEAYRAKNFPAGVEPTPVAEVAPQESPVQTQEPAQQPETPKARKEGSGKRGKVQDSDNLLQAIFKLGGLSKTEATQRGMDESGFSLFGRRLFNNGQNAKTYDEMAEALRGYEFDVPDPHALETMVAAAVNQGDLFFNPRGWELYAELQAKEQFNEEQAKLAMQLDSMIENGDITVDELTDEKIDEIFANAPKVSLEDLFETFPEDYEDVDETGSDAGSELPAEEALTDYTEDDLAERERESAASAAAERKAVADAEAKRKADLEVDTLPDEMLGNIGTRDVFSEDVDVDSLYSFAGPKSKTAVPLLLSSAEERLARGDDPETVRRETGWFRGEDGLLRYEISDSDARIKLDWFNGLEKFIKKYRMNATIKDLLHHPRLFAAYPQFADYGLSFRPSWELGGNGGIIGKRIFLASDQSKAEMLSVILHELQHAIQNYEGFAEGGTPESITPENYLDHQREMLDLLDLNIAKYKREHNDKMLEKVREQKRTLMDAANFKAYKRLAGEVEARNTQKRLKMTDRERMKKSPFQTADFRGRDVIVRINGRDLAMASAMPPANADSENIQMSQDTGHEMPVFENAQEAIVHLLKSIGPGIQTLLDNGVLNFTHGKKDWPLRNPDARAEAVYTGNKIYIDLNATDRGRLDAVILHEIGEHYGLRRMLGAEGYNSLLGAIRSRAKIKGSQAERVWNEVKAEYTHLEEGSDKFVAEVIAKLGEYNPQAPWYKRLLAQIKSFLIRMGLARGLTAGTITEADLHQLLRVSLQASANALKKGEGRFYGADQLYGADRHPLLNTDWNAAANALKKGEGRFYGVTGEAAYAIPVWHGSPHDHDGFDSSKIGTGEGAQAFGYGLYFTDKKEIAEYYRRALTSQAAPSFLVDGKDSDELGYRQPALQAAADGTLTDFISKINKRLENIDPKDEPEAFTNNSKNLEDAINLQGKKVETYSKRQGKLYQVELAPNEDEFLDWNKPLSEQSEKVKAALGISDFTKNNLPEGYEIRDETKDKLTEWDKSIGKSGYFTIYKNNIIYIQGYDSVGEALEGVKMDAGLYQNGEGLYHDLMNEYSSPKAASDYLHGIGIRGIRYDAEQGKSDASNYVVFSDEDVKITAKYSIPTNPANAVPPGEYNAAYDTWMAQVQRKVENMSDALFKNRLAVFTAHQLTELAQYIMPGLKEYDKLLLAREATVAEWMRGADRLVSQVWKKIPKPMQFKLSGVMHDSTLSDVDASKGWQFVEADEAKQQFRAATQATLGKRSQSRLEKAALSAGATSVSKNSATFSTEKAAQDFLSQLEGIETRQRNEAIETAKRNQTPFVDKNAVRKDAHTALQQRYGQLSDQAKQAYSESNNQHRALMQARLDGLEARIERAVLNMETRKQLIAEVRRKFESASLNWYYAPLTRYGDHWFYGTDANGKNWFITAESEPARNRKLKEFEDANGKIHGKGTNLKNVDKATGQDATDGFVTNVLGVLDANNSMSDATRDALKDEIYQLYLEILPDVSVRHNAMHRKGTLGFDADAMRAFSSAMHHGSTQLANMLYGGAMKQVLDDHRRALKISNSDFERTSAENKVKAAELLRDNWTVLSAPDKLEEELAAATTDAEKSLMEAAITLRNQLGKFKNESMAAESIDALIDNEMRILDAARLIPRKDNRKATDILDELYLSYQAAMNTNSSDMDRTVTKINQLNFLGMLGFSLSGGLVNMLQTPGVAMPVTAGRHGVAATMREYDKGFKEFMGAFLRQKKDADGNTSITELLREDLHKAAAAGNTAETTRLINELNAMEHFKEDGTISRTQTFDIIGVGQEGSDYGGVLSDLSKKAGFLFHHGERFNREVTLIANYRLETERLKAENAKIADPKARLKNGQIHQQAMDYAKYVVDRAHLDYASENAARIFRGPLAKMAFQFKKYSQGMLFLWGKSFADSLHKIDRADFANDTLFEQAKREQAEARRTFMGLLAMQTSLAGITGLPLMGALSVVYGLIGQAAGDDDDEPWDLERDLRLGLSDLFGDFAGEAMSKGIVNAGTPINLSSRLDQANIFFREPMKELEGRDAATNYVAQVFGPTGGTIEKVWQGFSFLADGQAMRGAEQLLPKFVSDLVKAGRFASEDVTSLSGEKVKDITATEIFWQTLGFSPSSVERKYAERNFTKARETAITEARSAIIHEAVKARMDGQPVDRAAIDEWNAEHPEFPITLRSIMSSLRGKRESLERKGDRGYSVNPKLEYLYEENDLMD
jgi:hypothetical protein